MIRKLVHRSDIFAIVLLIAVLASSVSAQTGEAGSMAEFCFQVGMISMRTQESLCNRFEGVKLSVYTDNQGRFQFQSLAAGNYEVIIEPNNDLYEVTSAKVEVFPGLPH